MALPGQPGRLADVLLGGGDEGSGGRQFGASGSGQRGGSSSSSGMGGSHKACQLLRLGLADNDLGEGGGRLLAELLEQSSRSAELAGAKAPNRTVQLDVRRNGFSVKTKLRLLAAVQGTGGGAVRGELVGWARNSAWDLTLADEDKRIDKWPRNADGALIPPR